MKSIWILIIGLIFTSLDVDAQCKSHHSKTKTSHTSWHPGSDIIDLAVGADQLSTLVVAVKIADLVSTLKSEGPFTVFAPVNSAFDKLPEGTVASLLEPDNQKLLQGILTYHVVKGSFSAKDIISGIQSSGGSFKVKTINGGILTAKMSGSSVLLKDEKGGVVAVAQTDITGSNGVVHLIDGVVMPQS